MCWPALCAPVPPSLCTAGSSSARRVAAAESRLVPSNCFNRAVGSLALQQEQRRRQALWTKTCDWTSMGAVGLGTCAAAGGCTTVGLTTSAISSAAESCLFGKDILGWAHMLNRGKTTDELVHSSGAAHTQCKPAPAIGAYESKAPPVHNAPQTDGSHRPISRGKSGQTAASAGQWWYWERGHRRKEYQGAINCGPCQTSSSKGALWPAPPNESNAAWCTNSYLASFTCFGYKRGPALKYLVRSAARASCLRTYSFVSLSADGGCSCSGAGSGGGAAGAGASCSGGAACCSSLACCSATGCMCCSAAGSTCCSAAAPCCCSSDACCSSSDACCCSGAGCCSSVAACACTAPPCCCCCPSPAAAPAAGRSSLA